MLNEAHNNNDITHIVNIVLNKAPNSNASIHVVNSMHLTIMGTQQFSMVTINRLTRDEIMTRKQERFMRTEIKLALGKNRAATHDVTSVMKSLPWGKTVRASYGKRAFSSLYSAPRHVL